MPRLFLEDFIPGSATPYGGMTVEHDAMLAFAREFDAQPMHVDARAAEATMAGQLIASGWFTAALNMRMMAEAFILDSASMGSPGVSELKWLKPVVAGDRLRGIRHVVDRRPSLSKPDRGFVNFRFELLNQRDEAVLEQANLIMFARRDAEPLADAAALAREDRPELPAFRDVAHDTIPFFEDLEVGERLDLGALTFTTADIVRFAKAYDPQYFHVDAEAAKGSIFGIPALAGWARWCAAALPPPRPPWAGGSVRRGSDLLPASSICAGSSPSTPAT
jgi:acyl dehydratase